MSAVEPLFSHYSATDILKNLFSPNPANRSGSDHNLLQPEQAADQLQTDAKRQDDHPFNANPHPTNVDADEGEQDMLQAVAKEISAEPNDNVQIDHFFTQPEQTEQGEESELVTKSDLVRVLETFVNVIMDNKEKQEAEGANGAHINLPRTLNFEPGVNEAIGELIDAKNAEIDELKTLLVEAQSTIITLLTDRVEDKAKIATFESQMRYLPDYQRLHTPPTDLPAAESEELRADLTKVKAELQSIKMTAFKTGFDRNPRWSGLKGWLSKFVGSGS